MHITHRIHILVPLLLGTAGLSLSASLLALITVADRYSVAESFHDTIAKAAGEYRENASLRRSREEAEATVVETAPELKTIEANKRTLRHRIVQLQSIVRTVGDRYHVDVAKFESAQQLLSDTKERLGELLHDGYVGAHAAAGTDVLIDGVSASQEKQRRNGALTKTQMTMIEELSSAVAASKELPGLRREYGQLLSYALDLRQQYDSAVEVVRDANTEMLDIQRILADVHEQVLKLQSELNRIDAKLRAKAERELIEKGLLAPRTQKDADRAIVNAPEFTWPAFGPVSAGFHDEGYAERFGVEHEGMDIVIPEASPVMSSADGIVFIVRDGGERGYTYVLIGHRGGYATLYGHLLSVAVHAGQEVHAGQQIGISGGRPDTPGSGPLTSGAHLHFEVIKSGENIDPRKVLP